MGYRIPGLAKDPTQQYLDQLQKVSEEQRGDLRDVSRSNVDYINAKYAAPVNAIDKGVDSYRAARGFSEEQNKWDRAAAKEGRDITSAASEEQLQQQRINEAELMNAQREAEKGYREKVLPTGETAGARGYNLTNILAPEAQIAYQKKSGDTASGQLALSQKIASDNMATNALGREQTTLAIDESKIASARNVFANAMSNQKTQGIPYDRNAVVATLTSSGKYTPQQIAEAERGAYVDPARVALANANLSQDTLKLADDADKYAQLIDQNKRAVTGYKAQTGGVFESDVSKAQLEEMAARMESTGLEGLSSRAGQLRANLGSKAWNAFKAMGSNQPIATGNVVDQASTALEDELIQDLESRLSKVPVEERSLPKVSKAMQTLAALKAQKGNRPRIQNFNAPPPGGGRATIQNASLPGDPPTGVSKYRPQQTEGGR